jgi:hypothetical protein
MDTHYLYHNSDTVGTGVLKIQPAHVQKRIDMIPSE